MNNYLRLYLNLEGISKLGKKYIVLTRVVSRPHKHIMIWK